MILKETVFHRRLVVDGVEIFYREAGPPDAPPALLLHGFPSSSHMFRNLIPLLADTYRSRGVDRSKADERERDPAVDQLAHAVLPERRPTQVAA